MEAIFQQIISMTVASSIVILAVLAARLLLKKTPRWITCLLWVLVAVRLVMPFSIKSGISLMPKSEPATIENNHIVQEAVIRVDDGQAYNDFHEQEPARTKQADVYCIIWVTGCAVMCLYGVVSSVLLRRKLASSIASEGRVYISDAIKTPFVFGIVSPKIYIPYTLSGELVHQVIKHEQAHLKRGDNIWKLLAYIMLSVYWFNPLVWLSFVLFERDIELACDEKVIARMDADDKKEYANALLSCATHRRAALSYPLYFGEIGVKARVKALKNYKKPTLKVFVFAAVIIAVVACCFLTDPKPQVTLANTNPDSISEDTNDDKYSELIAGPDGAMRFSSESAFVTDECTVTPYWYTFDGYVCTFCYGMTGDSSAVVWLAPLAENNGCDHEKTTYRSSGNESSDNYRICKETMAFDSLINEFQLRARVGEYGSNDRFVVDIEQTNLERYAYEVNVDVSEVLCADNATATEVSITNQYVKLRIENYETVDQEYNDLNCVLVDSMGTEYELFVSSQSIGECMYDDSEPYIILKFVLNRPLNVELTEISRAIISSNSNGASAVVDL